MKLVAEEILDAAGVGDITTLRRYDKESLTDNLSDGQGCNCLHHAARQGGADILEFLVKERGFIGYKRSSVGATAAHDAAAAGNLEALQWLIQHGRCNVDDQDGTGATVLHLAARFHHTHITEWLLDVKHADISKLTASNGIALHFAVVGGDYDAVKLLVDEDRTSVNYQLSSGATPTYLAAQEGQLEILRLLIQDYRGNVKIKSYDGMSCVHAAAQSGHLDCVRFLVDEEKCNANDRDFDGETPLHYAASQGHALVIDWLMKVGGARVTLDNLGGSPLHNAAESNQIECVKVLISNGCSTEITDNNGLTAAELARKCYNDRCANLIETFQPQSQFVIDEDVAYLHAVQSPRPAPQQALPVVSIGYTQNYPSYTSQVQPELLHNGATVNGAREQVSVTVHSGIGNQSPIQARSPSGYQQVQPLLNGTHLTDGKPEIADTASVSARADSDEFPVGIPRNFSQDWSVDTKQNKGSNSQSGSSSSLSSLSHSQEVEKDKITQNASLYRKPEDSVIENNQYTFVANVSKQTNNNTEFALLGQKEPKSVSFQTKTNYIETGLVSAKLLSKMDESVKDENERNERNVVTIIKPVTGEQGVMKEKVNGNGYNGDISDDSEVGNGVHENTGSVIITRPVTNTNIYTNPAPQNARSHVTNLEMLRDNMHALVNGKPTLLATGDVYQADTSSNLPQNIPSVPSPPPPPPVSSLPVSVQKQNHVSQPSENGLINHSTHNAPQMLGYGNQTSEIPAPPPPAPAFTHVNGNQEHNVELSAPPALQLGLGNQPAFVPAAPPPPPPPPPGAGNQSRLPVETSSQSVVHNSVSEEVKRKSASLPARPVGVFTAAMMKSHRSTLTPAQARTSIEKSSSNDFIAELKQATKGPALRKTSKNSEPGTKPVTPAMSFSSGQKTVIKDSVTNGDSKDSKAELTGEWDPKNFVDKVQNKGDLPVWKVQLQARQIAEKTMKETMEQRKVDERESRFKNMPAWKRALVEKKEKEAEARIEEEKLLQEQQAQKKVATKRVPAVNVTPNTGESGKLAPWQRELQKR